MWPGAGSDPASFPSQPGQVTQPSVRVSRGEESAFSRGCRREASHAHRGPSVPWAPLGLLSCGCSAPSSVLRAAGLRAPMGAARCPCWVVLALCNQVPWAASG